MATPSLDPVRLRMERVNEHRADLSREIQAFYATNPYDVIDEFDPEPDDPLLRGKTASGAHLIRARVRTPIPSRISILAGELLQGLRSALDYVAWQLALAKAESPPPTTAFPIFLREDLYVRDRLRFIGGIDDGAHSTFDAVQPHHAGDKAKEHPLWVLHRLANDDKHRIPHIVSSLPGGIVVDRPPGIDLGVNMRVGPFEDGDIVGSYDIIGGAEPETKLKVNASFGIAFGKDTPALGRNLAGEIDRIGREVDGTIRRFEPFFP